MMRFIALLLAGIFLATTPVSSTPSRTAGIQDTALGINGTHLFVLRLVDDNLGNYTAQATDIGLYSINLTNGEIEEAWIVSSFIDNSPDFAEYQKEARFDRYHQDDTINPFDVMQERDVNWLLPTNHVTANETVHIRNDAIVVLDDQQEVSHRLNHNEVTTRIGQAFLAARSLIPAHDTGPEPDPLVDVDFDIATMCTVGGQLQTGPIVLRLNCQDPEIGNGISIYLVIPPIEFSAG